MVVVDNRQTGYEHFEYLENGEVFIYHAEDGYRQTYIKVTNHQAFCIEDENPNEIDSKQNRLIEIGEYVKCEVLSEVSLVIDN